MRTIRSFPLWLALTAALVLTQGCALSGGAKVQNPADGVAVAYAGIAAAAATTTQLVRAGSLSAATATEVQAILEKAMRLNRIAEQAALAGKPQDALATLALVNSVLLDVQTYLKEWQS